VCFTQWRYRCIAVDHRWREVSHLAEALRVRPSQARALGHGPMPRGSYTPAAGFGAVQATRVQPGPRVRHADSTTRASPRTLVLTPVVRVAGADEPHLAVSDAQAWRRASPMFLTPHHLADGIQRTVDLEYFTDVRQTTSSVRVSAVPCLT
jgi:hypothetical protein